MDFSLRKCIFCCENEFLAANIRRAAPAFTADFEFRGHVRAFGRASCLIAALEALNIHGSQLVFAPLQVEQPDRCAVFCSACGLFFRPIFQVSTVVVVGSSILGPFAMTTVRDNYHTGPVRDDNSFILFPTYIDHGLWT